MSRSLRQIFLIPLAVAVSSAIGFIAALVGDGWWDALSWPTLGVVVVLALWYGVGWRRRQSQQRLRT